MAMPLYLTIIALTGIMSSPRAGLQLPAKRFAGTLGIGGSSQRLDNRLLTELALGSGGPDQRPIL